MTLFDAGPRKEAAFKAAKLGRWTDAEQIHLEILSQDPRDLETWLGLAAVRRADGRLETALEAVDGALSAQPRSFVAHLTKGALLEQLGSPRTAAASYGLALALVPEGANISASLLGALKHADKVKARYIEGLGAHLRSAVRIGPDQLSDAASNRRIHAFIDRMLGHKRPAQQQPTQFFYPDMPAIEFWDAQLFPWLADLESCTVTIQEELRDVMATEAAEFAPYVALNKTAPIDQWADLNHSRRWSSYHLWRQGEIVEAAKRRCRATFEAMGLIPQPHVVNRSPASMFSTLQARTRIPPHTGVANTRLVLHLPLIVPPGCGFRVGAETREWQVGKAWVFDDTIEHEAWNDSDEARVILICDVWNPLLSEGERQAIAALIASLDEFNGETPSGDAL